MQTIYLTSEIFQNMPDFCNAPSGFWDTRQLILLDSPCIQPSPPFGDTTPRETVTSGVDVGVTVGVTCGLVILKGLSLSSNNTADSATSELLNVSAIFCHTLTSEDAPSEITRTL